MKTPKNCPRCNNIAELKIRDDDVWYGCYDVKCLTFCGPSSTNEEALKKWNKTDEENLYGTPLSFVKKTPSFRWGL